MLRRWKEGRVVEVTGERVTEGGRWGKEREMKNLALVDDVDVWSDGLVSGFATLAAELSRRVFGSAGWVDRGCDFSVSPALIGRVGSIGKLEKTEA